MASAEASPQLTVEGLLAGVKRLPPAERLEFQRRLRAWQEQEVPGGEEAVLLARIKANSDLPTAQKRRFERLRQKRQEGALTSGEERGLKDLWQRVEQMNAARLRAVTDLAACRGADVRDVLRELGLGEKPDVF